MTAKRWLKAVVGLLLPRVCTVCGRKLNLDEEHLCLHCWAELPLTHFWERRHNEMADKFNRLLESGIDHYLTEGRLERYAFAAALFFYDGTGNYRHITHRLKYQGDIQLGRYFGKLLGLKLKKSKQFADIDLVIPVPLHWTRWWKRGYNQAEIIAQEVADTLGVYIRTDILKRRRRTRTQTKMTPEEKSRNVSGAFQACLDNIKKENYRHIILLDDVFTSGSTLHSCFLALRSALPVSVRISIATLGYVGGA